ncbi:lysophosphatidic acid receptor 6 [Chanos chanos]|uniref:Lysophosphatidic acid receptor 6 n=1 Tax=Chanos chanos TaxID=29144 RepID=A0A6J2W2D9_CHACN|nr:lysophosphatidic acid receptor 6-like [Chanos chanos]
MTNLTNPCSNDEFKYTLYSSAFGIVFVFGLLFNMAAMYIFVCTLKLRNETTIYMMNLMVSDLLFVLSLPFRIFYFINRHWPFGEPLCQISVALFYTNMYGSILFLTCINVDRFLAIVYPFRSRAVRTRRNAKIACCAVWVLVLSVSFPIGFQLDTREDSNRHYCFENFTKNQWQSKLSKVVVFIETVGFLIPLVINITCSTMILKTLRDPQTINRGGQLNKSKVMRMIVVHLLIFCFCFIPYNINLALYTLVRSRVLNGCNVESVIRTLYPITFCIAVTNCCFDPVVYYFTSETIQNSIKRKSYAVRNHIKQCDGLQNCNEESSIRTLRATFTHTESTV